VERRVEALRIAETFRARVVDTTTGSFVFEITGASDKLDASSNLMRDLGLAESPRTGIAALARGARTISSLQLRPHSSTKTVKRNETMRVYYDRDADVNLIKGKNVAIIAMAVRPRHATNLKDSGGGTSPFGLRPNSTGVAISRNRWA